LTAQQPTTLSSNKVVIAYSDVSNSNYGTAIVGTVSGTSISFGSAAVFESAASNYISATYDTNAEKIVIAYIDGGNSNYGTTIVGTVSGTSISFGSSVVFETTITFFISATYNSANQKIVISYSDSGNSEYGTSVVYQNEGTNSADFIGITDAAISDTASGSVTIKGGISTNVTGLTANALYYVQDDGSISSPTASVPYVIDGASYDSVSFSVAGQETTPLGMIFGNNGTKMYIVGAGASVYQYTLSSGFDLSTASFDSVSFSVTSQDTSPRGIAFNLTGEKMFIIGQGSDAIYQYTLSIAWDVSSASYDSVSFSVSAQDTTPQDLFFNLDGSKVFMVGDTTDTVYQYSLSTPFVISSASYDSVSFSAASQSTGCVALSFNNTGTRMFISDYQNDTIYQYSLSSGFDLSTASYDSINFSVASQSDNPQGLAFSSDGTKFFVTTVTGSSVFQYSTGAGSVTSVLAGKALSSTSINLDYTT
jgi:hypothetical protein